MDMGPCLSCQKIRKLQTAPGGALICGDCNEIFKTVNLARLRGMSDDELGARIRKLIENMDNE